MQATSALRTDPMPNKLLAKVLGKSSSVWLSSVKDSIQSVRLAAYTTEHLLEGTVVPAMQAVVDMQETWTDGLVSTLRGDQSYRDFASDTWTRMRSGARFNRLVNTVGRELFGSARFAGETVLLEDERFRLTYIPPAEGTPAGPPLFHAGGAIPYGDQLFRLLPEANLYERFTERGMPAYAMEMRGDRHEVDYGGLTVDEHVDRLERFIDEAHKHADRQLVLEGYCGHGMQLLPYLAAKPAHAADKICAVALFVSPVHGPACSMIADMPRLMPSRANDLQLAIWEQLSGYVWGDGLRYGLDLALKKNFIKTPLGRFYDGWTQTGFADVHGVDDLNPVQRKVLAGAYWISPHNCNRFPISVDLVRYANAMFGQGLSRDGALPQTYRDQPLSLAAFAEQTSMPFVGFYGGNDPMIIDRTAYPLMKLLGQRYHHVVHPNAGHVSYVFSQELWDLHNANRLDPNPVDLLRQLTAEAEAEADPD